MERSHFVILLCTLVISCFAERAFAGGDLAFADDTDLTSFITRPELKVPRFNVSHKAEHGISPGLWFMGPYAKIDQEVPPMNYYQACSTGPTIYDGDGELVWSGACLVENQNTCDFRSFTDRDGNHHLSMIFHGYHEEINRQASIMDSTYSLATARNTTPPVLENLFNMHEYKVIDHGRSALYIVTDASRIDVRGLNLTSIQVGWVSNVGFREVSLETGETTYEWWCLDDNRILPSESTVAPDEDAMSGPWPRAWNWFHPNSVDKSTEGDYLVSGRFVDTIYKISGKDGSVAWRLGGKQSDFTMVGFNFSKQHDAQFMGTDPTTGDELISLFDNAKAIQGGGIDTEPTSNISSGLIVSLDTSTWTARLLRRVDRPDNGITALRGNFQRLPNGNVVGGWSENGYVSEHTIDGRVIFEGRFASTRFVNYRAYKCNFTGNPTEPPILKVFVFGQSRGTSTTVWYVSWNGATEVANWRFLRAQDEETLETVGSTDKTGFETVFHSEGPESLVVVEAVAANGSTIGRSAIVQAVLPHEWHEDEGMDDIPSTTHTNSVLMDSWKKTEL